MGEETKHKWGVAVFTPTEPPNPEAGSPAGYLGNAGTHGAGHCIYIKATSTLLHVRGASPFAFAHLPPR